MRKIQDQNARDLTFLRFFSFFTYFFLNKVINKHIRAYFIIIEFIRVLLKVLNQQLKYNQTLERI